VRIPRENLLNAVADVTPDGKYESAIKDPDQVGVLCEFDWSINSSHSAVQLKLKICVFVSTSVMCFCYVHSYVGPLMDTHIDPFDPELESFCDSQQPFF
jgi:hypothetical protein